MFLITFDVSGGTCSTDSTTSTLLVFCILLQYKGLQRRNLKIMFITVNVEKSSAYFIHTQ